MFQPHSTGFPAAAPNTSFFGQPASSPFATPPRPAGGLFGNMPASTAPATGSFPGLGGAFSSGPATGGFPSLAPQVSFGPGAAAPAGNQLFSMSSSQPPAGAPGLFGQTSSQPTWGAAGGMAQPASVDYSLMGRQREEDARAMNEITQVLINFNALHSELYPGYMFKHIVYNQVNDDQKQYIRQFQVWSPVQYNMRQQQVPVPEPEWREAVLHNPVPDKFYPYQISSWEELYTRVKRFKATQDELFSRLQQAQANLQSQRKFYASEVLKSIEERKRVNKMLFDKLITLYGAIEKIAIRNGRVVRDVSAEVSLSGKLQQIEKKIELPETKSGVSELKSKTEELKLGRESAKEDGAMKGVSKESAARLLKSLSEQRKGIEGVIRIHMQNMHEAAVLISGFKELASGESAPMVTK